MNFIKKSSIKKFTYTIVGLIAVTMMLSLTVTNFNINHQYQALAQQINLTNNTSAIMQVSPHKSDVKDFWIKTVHLDGMTNINAAVKCDTCSQNIPTHPAEQPPLNSTIPTGGGFVITEPNKVGAWDFRTFTFVPSQMVVFQGDKVTLHFVGVQGVHHNITVDGLGTFSLNRGQIHTVSFVANNPGVINFACHIHPPNMVGQILVLPKTT